jgi:hypothetical protein
MLAELLSSAICKIYPRRQWLIMNNRLKKSCFCLLFELFFCKIIFSQISIDTIAKYECVNYNGFQEINLINNQQSLDSLLTNTGYDSTRASIQLSSQPDFGQVIVFAFMGWPCIVDTVIEGQDTITIEFSLNYYDQQILSRPPDEVTICTMLKTGKAVIFVNNSVSVKYRSHLSSTDTHLRNASSKKFDCTGRLLPADRTSSKLTIVSDNNRCYKGLYFK